MREVVLHVKFGDKILEAYAYSKIVGSTCMAARLPCVLHDFRVHLEVVCYNKGVVALCQKSKDEGIVVTYEQAS